MSATGKVIRFDEFKGYGFVSPDGGGEDVFIHVNDLDFDKRLLAPGVHVEYVAEEGDRGLKASRVRILDRPSQRTTDTAHRTTAAPDRSDAHADGDYEDVICDVLTPQEFSTEVTEALLASDTSLTSAQILAVRASLSAVARSHKWIEG